MREIEYTVSGKDNRDVKEKKHSHKEKHTREEDIETKEEVKAEEMHEENKEKENASEESMDPEEAARAAAMAAEALGEEIDAGEKCSEEGKNPKDAKIEELEDRLKRNMAEFDNFRKRNEKEKASMFDMGIRHIADRILPLIDNFERGFANVPDDIEAKAFAEGMEMIYKQLLKTLEDAGIVEIDALGKAFDPNYHNAVLHVEDESAGENTIVEILQKGYMYKDTVLRYSMVKVAN